MIEIRTATVVPADRMVAFNGEAYASDEFVFAPPLPNVLIPQMDGPPARGLYLHAIQWWGDHGQIETSAGPAIPFKARGIVEPYLPQWLKVRAAVLAERAGHAAAQLVHHDAAATQHREALAALEADIAAAESADGVTQTAKDALAAHRARLDAAIADHAARRPAVEKAAADAKAKADAAAADLG